MVSTFPPHAQVWVHHTPLTSSPDLIDNSERYILVFVTRRKAGVSREQFVEHYEKVSSVELLSQDDGLLTVDSLGPWGQVHPSYSLRMPGLLCYRQNVLLEGTGPGGMGMDQFDALSEYHYVSKKAYREAMESDIGKELQADSALFMSVVKHFVESSRDAD